MELNITEKSTILECLRTQQKIIIHNNPNDHKSIFKLRILIEKFERDMPIGGLP